MEGNNETQHGFMSTDDIPSHFLRRETHRRLLDIWRRIHTHFMIYDRRNMEDELLRLITFLHFPECLGQDIRVLAIAGFYYFGESDIVVCYCCGLWKRNWTRADEPWTIHTRLSAACLFIRNNRQVNLPYYGITERGLRHLEQTTELLQQTAIASGPSFVRSGSEIQAGIMSNIHRVERERHNNRDIERIERQNVLPVANLQMRETHVGGFYMSAERRYAYAHELYIDIETRIISIANERRNITYNASHLGRGINSTEYADMAQSQSYLVSSENNSEHLANMETSFEREYASEENFDEETDRSSVQNSRLTFHSIQEQEHSTSGDETAPKQVITVPTTLTNNYFTRRLSRSISAPTPNQYSCQSPSHLYLEHTNCQDGYHRSANESTNACNPETCVVSESSDLASEVLKDIEQSGLSADSENSFLFMAPESEERALPSTGHENNIVSYDNTSYGTQDSDETLLKRIHLDEEIMEAHAKIDANKILGVPECYDRTCFTGCGTGTPTTNITHLETASVEGIEEQCHLSGKTYTTDIKIEIDSSEKMQESVSNDETATTDMTEANLAKPRLLSTSDQDRTDRANMNPKKSDTFCETYAENSSFLPSELKETVTIFQNEFAEPGPLIPEQAFAAANRFVNTLESTNNPNETCFQSTKTKIHQISQIDMVETPPESKIRPATTVESSKPLNTFIRRGENVSIKEELEQVDEVNEGSSMISVSHVIDRARVLKMEETVVAEVERNNYEEKTTQNDNNLKNISILLNRPNETEISMPEFSSIHQQNIASITQMQRKPDKFQNASPLDISYEAPMHDLVLKSNDSSKADRERQPGAMFQNEELVDALHNQESIDESDKTKKQQHENVSVVLRGPESYMGCDDMCLRPKLKSRQRHFSEGDSPHLIPTVPRPESRRRAVKNNSTDTGFYNADKEIVDALCNQEDNEESGYAGIQPPENLPVMLRGPENNICIRTKLKARQRHLSEGDSPDFIPIGPRHKPLQNYPTVESRRRSFRNNSASPSEQLADAGFYSAGKDRIRCFSCETEFQYSQLENDIWIEHAKASPRCEYLLQRKGQDFVKAVLRDDAILVQLHLKILTTESRRICFSADRTSEDENEAVSEEALEGVVLKCD